MGGPGSGAGGMSGPGGGGISGPGVGGVGVGSGGVGPGGVGEGGGSLARAGGTDTLVIVCTDVVVTVLLLDADQVWTGVDLPERSRRAGRSCSVQNRRYPSWSGADLLHVQAVDAGVGELHVVASLSSVATSQALIA